VSHFPNKRLIVNADDFGMTAGVNHAVAEVCRKGIVTSTSLMATGLAFEPALELARHERLNVGCHVVLLQGTPLLPPRAVPGLVSCGRDGQCVFRRGLGEFIGAATTGHLPAEEVAREATAQIRKLQQAGIAVTHVDTHKHAHVFPEVFRPLMRAAHACGVRAMRNPFEPPQAMRWGEVLLRPALWARYLPVRMLRVFAAEFRHQAWWHGIAIPDGTLGITLTGYLNEASLMELLRRVPDGTWELCCHPAYEDAHWQTLGPKLGSGERERELLCSPALRQQVERMGIELISYAELAQETRKAAA
jgi:hopanoid biosynthesis associated protein HpnK